MLTTRPTISALVLLTSSNLNELYFEKAPYFTGPFLFLDFSVFFLFHLMIKPCIMSVYDPDLITLRIISPIFTLA